MTEQQKPQKWYDEIVAWASGEKVDELWRYGSTWKLVAEDVTPEWNNPDFEFRIHDPCRKYREAQNRGEVVEELDANGIWRAPSSFAVSRGFRVEFTRGPERYRIAKPEPKEEELYVLVSERDVYHDVPNSRPIIWEQHIDHGEASLEGIKRRQERIGDRYGKTRIARLVFIDIGEN